MASTKFAVATSHIECSVCLNTFNDPRMLPCGHTFCLQCITTQINKSTNEKHACAVCRHAWTLPAGGVNSLPKNFVLLSVISAANEEENLMSSKKVSDRRFFCKKHSDQKIVIYCRDCKILACAVCGLTLHSKHTCIETDQADEEFKSAIRDKVKKLNQELTICSTELKDLEQKVFQKRAEHSFKENEIASCEKLLSDEASFVERSSIDLLENIQTLTREEQGKQQQQQKQLQVENIERWQLKYALHEQKLKAQKERREQELRHQFLEDFLPLRMRKRNQ